MTKKLYVEGCGYACAALKMSQISGNDVEGHKTIDSKANQKGQKTIRLVDWSQIEKGMSKSGCCKGPE